MADRRITPARPDLAAAHLKGKVEAERFVEGFSYWIGKGRVSLRSAPSDDAAQDSELLYGESITVYERKDGWLWVQADRDHYVGYVRENVLNDTMASTMRVNALMAPAFAKPDFKTPVCDLLPMNAHVAVLARQGEYVKIGPEKFLHFRQLVHHDEFATDFVAVAERFVGAPYVWGGKTVAGLDCSGLIQTALQAAGISSPRDTDMMEKALGVETGGADLQRGDLVFWKGHVGVMLNASHLLHANAFHMEVFAEPLDAAKARIAKSGSVVTSVRRL